MTEPQPRCPNCERRIAKRLSAEQEALILKLLTYDTLPVAEIARQVGVSDTTIFKRAKRLGIVRTRGPKAGSITARKQNPVVMPPGDGDENDLALSPEIAQLAEAMRAARKPPKHSAHNHGKAESGAIQIVPLKYFPSGAQRWIDQLNRYDDSHGGRLCDGW